MPHTALAGKWKLNVTASTLPFAPPQSVVVEIAVEADRITLTEHAISAEGAAETTKIHARMDGQPYSVEGSAFADRFAIERVREGTWQTNGTKSGIPTLNATLTLSSDGMILYEYAETTLRDGRRAPATLVFERQP
jgi:hypothetical protein